MHRLHRVISRVPVGLSGRQRAGPAAVSRVRQLSTTGHVEDQYMSLVNGGELQYDENQYQIILQFMKVQKACYLPKLKYDDSPTPEHNSEPTASSLFGALWNTVSGGSATPTPTPPVEASKVNEEEGGGENEEVDRRGIYVYGSVGIGKTLMMDMLYDTTEIEMKRRVHFHKVSLTLL